MLSLSLIDSGNNASGMSFSFIFVFRLQSTKNPAMTNTTLASVLICCFFVTVTLACKCQFQPAQVSFCKAHWVAHTKVDLRQTKQANPTRKGLNNIRYKVTYGDVFKKPENISSLPTDIYTPSEPPACGLLLEAGKEYLLAGRIVNGTATTVLCGQILQDDPDAKSYEKVLEWGEVPASLQNRLKIHAFDKC